MCSLKTGSYDSTASVKAACGAWPASATATLSAVNETDGKDAVITVYQCGSLGYASIDTDSYVVFTTPYVEMSGTTDARIGGGLYVGSTGTDPATGTITATDYICALGGLHVGGTSDPGTDNLVVDSDGRIGGGLYVGSTGTDPATGEIHATNGMVIHTPVADYLGYAIDMHGGGGTGWARGFRFTNGTTLLGEFGGLGWLSSGEAGLTYLYVGYSYNGCALRVYQGDARCTIGYNLTPSDKCSGPSLTINQTTNDGPILVLQSTDVDHGMTTYWDTDTYGSLGKYSANYGGLMVDGVTKSTAGLHLRGIVTTADETHSASGAGCVQIVAWLKDGTTIQAPWGSDNILAIRAGSSTRAIFTAAGDLYLDNNQHAYAWDEFDDCELVRAVELHRSPATVIRTQFDEFVRYNREVLEETGLVQFNDDGHNFVNLSGMSRLHSGAIWQLYVEKEQLRERVEKLEQEVKLLRAA